MDSSFTKGVLACAAIQVARPSEREGPAHYDGAAHLLQAGLTVWGGRAVVGWKRGVVRQSVQNTDAGAMFCGVPWVFSVQGLF